MSPKALTIPEPALLRQAAAGSEPAFTELFHHYKDKLYSFLIRLTGSPEMTEDAIQDIFLKLWKNRTALTGIDNFGSYIFRMAQNQCISHFKRAARETLILAELQQQTPAPGAPDPGNALDAREIQQRLRQALAKLPPQQKLVYTLSREEGLRHEEIAERLHISPSTVKNHMIKALSTLRNQLTNPAATSAFNIIPPVVPAIAIASLLLAIIEAFEK